MEYPFVILSVYIILFFLLCLTSFSVDVEDDVKVKGRQFFLETAEKLDSLDEQTGGVENVKCGLSNENGEDSVKNENGEDSVKNENVEEGKSVVNGGRNRFNNWQSIKEKILSVLTMFSTYFFIAGLGIDKYIWDPTFQRRSKRASIITSVMSIVILIFVTIIVKFSLKKSEEQDTLVGLYATIFVCFILANFLLQYLQLFLKKKLDIKKNSLFKVLVIICSIARIMSFSGTVYIHPFCRIHHILNNPSVFIVEFFSSAITFSLTFFLLSLVAHVFHTRRFAALIYKVYNDPVMRILVNLAQIDTVFSILLLFFSDDSRGYIVIPLVCIALISLFTFFDEKNKINYEWLINGSKNNENNERNGIELSTVDKNVVEPNTENANDIEPNTENANDIEPNTENENDRKNGERTNVEADIEEITE